jgi:hypothetical protein
MSSPAPIHMPTDAVAGRTFTPHRHTASSHRTFTNRSTKSMALMVIKFNQ